MSNNLLARLGQDHQRIERVLNLVERELHKFKDDDCDEDLHAIATALDYMEAYPDKVHHPVEELLFDTLEQIADSAAREAIVTLRAQHEAIISSTRTLKRDVEDILNDIVVPIDRLLEHLHSYVTLQREHMFLENSVVFPAASSTLGADDWQTIEAQLRGNDPLFDGTDDRFNDLYTRIVEDFGSDPATSPEDKGA